MQARDTGSSIVSNFTTVAIWAVVLSSKHTVVALLMAESGVILFKYHNFSNCPAVTALLHKPKQFAPGVNIEGLGIVLKKIEDAFRKKRLNQLLMLWRKLPPPWGDIVLISVTVRGDIYVLKFTHTKFWNTCKIVTRRVATFFLVRKKHFIGIWLLNLLWSSIFFKTIPNPSILTPEFA